MVDHIFVSKLNLVEGGKNVTTAARFGGWENVCLEDVSMMSIVFIMGTKLGCCVVGIVFHGCRRFFHGASKDNFKTCLKRKKTICNVIDVSLSPMLLNEIKSLILEIFCFTKHS